PHRAVFGAAHGRSSSRRVGHAPTEARRNPAAAKRLPAPPGEHIVYYVALLIDRVALSCWHPSIARPSNLRKYARWGAIWIVLTPAIFAQNLGGSHLFRHTAASQMVNHGAS